jgi:YVTN family beta-propeller protein
MRDKLKGRSFPQILFLATGVILLALGTGVSFANEPLVAAQRAEPTPLPLYALPDPRSNPTFNSNTLALAEDNRTLVAANMLNNTVSIVIPLQGEVLAEIPVGRDPRSVALAADDTLALVANRGDGTLSVVGIQEQAVLATIPLEGIWPYAVVANGSQLAYVSLQGSDEIAIVDIAAQQVVRHIPVPDAPAGLAVWGDFLYVTHLWSGDVSLIYLPQEQVVSSASTGGDTGLSQAIELDISRGIAYLPQTRSYTENANLTFDTTVFPVVNVMDLRGMTLQRRTRITLDTADRPVNMPFAVALDRFRQWLFVANAGSNNVSVIDLNTGLARSHIEVGANPRGILLNRDGSFLFVHNVLDGTITVVETRNDRIVDVLPISDLTIPVDVLIGAQLFHSAVDPRLSAGSWMSCANCHFDGQPDGRTWLGFPGGPRNTPALYNLLETAPYNWSGTWDELADVELKIRSLQAGEGLIEAPDISDALGEPHAGLSLDLDTLVVYLTTLQPPPASPAKVDPDKLARGEAVFNEQGCANCHVGPAATNLQSYAVGTGSDPNARYDTPSLRWLWLTAPYFHDGSAETLYDVFAMPGAHQLIQTVPAEDIGALVAYLLTLPQQDVP